MAILLITFEDLTTSTPIGGNVDTDKYNYCIEDAQNSKLKELLGDTLYLKIETDYDNNDLTGDYLILYNEFVKPILIHQSAIEYLGVASYQIANGGVYKHQPANGNPVETKDIEFLINSQSLKVEYNILRLNRWLLRKQLPEYKWHYDNIVNPKVESNSFNFDFISVTQNVKKDNRPDNRYD
jgi:hypothetical protein